MKTAPLTPTITDAAAQLHALEAQEAADLAQRESRQAEIDRLRSELEAKRADLLAQAAAMSAEIDATARAEAAAQAALEAQAAAAQRVLWQDERTTLLAEQEAALRQVEALAATLCATTTLALDLTIRVSNTTSLIDTGVLGGAVPAHNALRRQLADRLTYLLRYTGGLGSSVEQRGGARAHEPLLPAVIAAE